MRLSELRANAMSSILNPVARTEADLVKNRRQYREVAKMIHENAIVLKWQMCAEDAQAIVLAHEIIINI